MRAPALASLAAVAFLAGCGGGGATPATADYTGKTVRLGAVLSLQGAGAAYGAQQKQGIVLAVDAVNKAGILGGKVEVDIQDDGSDQATGAALFKSEVGDKKALGLIGPTLANTAAAAHPVANDLKTPVIAASLTGNGVVGNCSHPCDYVFRDSLGEAAAIPYNVKAAVQRYHPHKVVLFYANDDKVSFDGAQDFRRAFADNGITVDLEVPFPKATTGFADLVTPALARKADAWAVSGIGDVPAGLVLEARKQGYQGPLLGGDGFNSYSVSRAVGDKGAGAQSAAPYYEGLPGAANQDFVAAFQAKYRDDQGKPELPGELAAQAYTAVLLFAEAARHANLGFSDPAADRARLKQALAATTVDSPLGPVAFTTEHDVRQDVYVLAMDRKGGFTLVTTYKAQ